MNKFFRKSRKTKPLRKRATGTTVRKRTARPSRTFTKNVLKVIHKETESKQCYHTSGDTLIAFNSGINATGDILRLVPNMSAGTAENQRVGDEVRAQRLSIKGVLQMYVNADGNTVGPKRIAVRVMIVQPKRYNTWSDIQTNVANWSGSLLKKGGTVVSFTGIMSDIWAPINRPAITVYSDKLYYMNQEYLNNVTGVGIVPQIQGRNVCRFFSKTFKLRNKKLEYDANIDGNILPTKFMPVMIIGYVHLDGSAADVLTTQVSVQYDTMLTYEDA